MEKELLDIIKSQIKDKRCDTRSKFYEMAVEECENEIDYPYMPEQQKGRVIESKVESLIYDFEYFRDEFFDLDDETHEMIENDTKLEAEIDDFTADAIWKGYNIA